MQDANGLLVYWHQVPLIICLFQRELEIEYQKLRLTYVLKD